MTHPLEKAAEEWLANNYSDSSMTERREGTFHISKVIFAAGAKWQEQRILEMLRNDEAVDDINQKGLVNEQTATVWADWLEEKLKEEK